MWYLIIAVLLVAELIISSLWIKTVCYEADFHNLPDSFDGYQIVLLGDLHGKQFGKQQKRLLKRVTEHPSDLIVIAGDLFDKHQEQQDEIYNLMETLVHWCPVVLVPGNHEIVGGEEGWQETKIKLIERGVDVLDDVKKTIECGADKIELFGFRTPLGCYGGVNRKLGDACEMNESMLTDLFGKTSEDIFQILVSHHPDYFETYAQWGADLSLSAHMHGGLIRLPGIGGLLSTEVKFFPKYHGGVYEKDGRKMVVTRGLASGRFKFRLWNRPELTMVRLTKKQAA